MNRPQLSQQESLDLLKLEMQLLQQRLMKFDELIWKIRSWAVALTIALTGWAVTTDTGTSPALLGFAALVPLLFWLEEGAFRSNYYHKYIVRYRRLREAFNDPSVAASSLPLYDLSNHIEGRGPRSIGLQEAFIRPEAILFYLILALVPVVVESFI